MELQIGKRYSHEKTFLFIFSLINLGLVLWTKIYSKAFVTVFAVLRDIEKRHLDYLPNPTILKILTATAAFGFSALFIITLSRYVQRQRPKSIDWIFFSICTFVLLPGIFLFYGLFFSPINVFFYRPHAGYIIFGVYFLEIAMLIHLIAVQEKYLTAEELEKVYGKSYNKNPQLAANERVIYSVQARRRISYGGLLTLTTTRLYFRDSYEYQLSIPYTSIRDVSKPGIFGMRTTMAAITVTYEVAKGQLQTIRFEPAVVSFGKYGHSNVARVWPAWKFLYSLNKDPQKHCPSNDVIKSYFGNYEFSE